MARKALVTVVIPTYNRAKHLRKSIRSVQRQTFKRWNLLIVDDGSTDRTRRVVKQSFPISRIRYVRHSKNKGVSLQPQSCIKINENKILFSARFR